MRIALVSPYSWTYQGGVNRHVEALAEEFLGRGHDVRVLAPWDPPDRLSRWLHRADAEPRKRPDYLIPLGRTIGFAANGAVSNLSAFPDAVTSMRRELREGGYDVVHVHEPVAPAIGWDAMLSTRAPLVGTFHAYSTKAFPNHIATLLGARRAFNKLSARIAVSEAAAWTGRRWFGGEYAIVPNGVDVDAAPAGPKPSGEELRLLFVGRPEERKGLPVLLTALGGLVEHVPCRLVVIGAEKRDISRYLTDPELAEHIETRGRVSGDELWWALHEADVLCAPSLSGESFGMVLTEAFAAGTPVIASNIAGYNDVVRDGVDGVLVPPADPQRLAEELQRAHHDRRRLREMGEAARRSARRYAWPHVADQVTHVYDRAIAAPAPQTKVQKVARDIGLMRADGGPPRPARRLPSLDPQPSSEGGGGRRAARRIGLGVAAVLGLGLTALAANKIGISKVVESIVRSDFGWVTIAFALMSLSMFLRAASWFSIARAALPNRPLRRRDVTSATMIGVLMSATLPARLGEPARAMVLARRTGRMRETFPVLLGTLVSQTVLNLVALVLLGVIIVASTDLFHSSSQKLFAFSFVPLAILVIVLLAPALMRNSGSGRLGRLAAQRPRRCGSGAARAAGLPRSAPRRDCRRRPARRLGDPARRLLGAARRPRARPSRRDRRRGGGSFRGQRHRGRPRNALEHRHLPARCDQRAHHRVRDRLRERACLRRDPAGDRDRDRGRARASRPGPRGDDLERHAPARPLRRTGSPQPLSSGARFGRQRASV